MDEETVILLGEGDHDIQYSGGSESSSMYNSGSDKGLEDCEAKNMCCKCIEIKTGVRILAFLAILGSVGSISMNFKLLQTVF